MSEDDYTSTESSTISNSSGGASVLVRVELLEKSENKQDGTKENPYIIIIDPSKPECGNGFEVVLVPQVQVENFVRSVYHVRHVTTEGLESEWSATIPHEEFPALAHRAVLIRGPSQEFWHRRPDIYHEEPFCKQTKLAHESQQTAIKQSIVREKSYWLLVLPRGTLLENHVISHNSVHVKKAIKELATTLETEDDDGNVTEEVLYGTDVYWRIAVQGGNMVSDPGSATKKRRKSKKKAATERVGTGTADHFFDGNEH
jgi:hypothetical protein